MLNRTHLMAFVLIIGCGGERDAGVLLKPGLSLTQRTHERLTGTFVKGDVIVHFDSIKTAAGSVMHIRKHDGRTLIKMENRAGTTVMNILDRATVTFAADAKGEFNDDAPVVEGDVAALEAVLQAPETQALPEVSEDLGEEGVTGASDPASLELHVTAMGVAKTQPAPIPEDSALTASSSKDEREAVCTDVRSDPYRNGCYGLCGNGCNVWRWVCGDACSHAGCRHHDDHCRGKGFGNWFACWVAAPVHFFHGGGCAL